MFTAAGSMRLREKVNVALICPVGSALFLEVHYTSSASQEN